MFGMSSTEFWEEDPQLYWAYRTFYLKQKEFEQEERVRYMKYEAWLYGYSSHIAHSTALNNAFSKQKRNYPKYEEMFNDKEKQPMKSQQEVNLHVQEEFNAWARL